MEQEKESHLFKSVREVFEVFYMEARATDVVSGGSGSRARGVLDGFTVRLPDFRCDMLQASSSAYPRLRALPNRPPRPYRHIRSVRHYFALPCRGGMGRARTLSGPGHLKASS